MTAASVAMSTLRIGQRLERRANIVGADGRQISLNIDNDFDAVLGVNGFERLVNAIRAGLMIAARHDRAAPGFFHRRCDSLRIGCDDGIADFSSFCAAQHVHDHRGTVQVRQWLAGQAS